MKKVIKVPEYFKDLPDNANLNSRDVAAIFGYSQVNNMLTDMRSGRVPKHEVSMKCGSINHTAPSGTRGTKHVFWKVKTVREWIENHQ